MRPLTKVTLLVGILSVVGCTSFAAALPGSRDECRDGGWRRFGVFRNQGDCISFVATGGKNPPDFAARQIFAPPVYYEPRPVAFMTSGYLDGDTDRDLAVTQAEGNVVVITGLALRSGELQVLARTQVVPKGKVAARDGGAAHRGPPQ